jgi:hypothetical protein
MSAPNLSLPKTDDDDPTLVKFLILALDPVCTKSNALTADPILPKLLTLIVDPM